MYASSVGSEAAWSLLFGHPFFRAVMDAKHALELSAGIAVELVETDAALANRRFCARAWSRCEAFPMHLFAWKAG
eukprot:4857452-Alexandrium_andersonii.AAC.1